MHHTIRKIIQFALSPSGALASLFDDECQVSDVPSHKWVGHQHWGAYLLELVNKEGMNVLNI